MKQRFINGVLATSATIVALLLTTLPGDTPLVLSSSRAIGGTDLTDALGHVALFAVLTILWFHAVSALTDSRTTLVVTVLLILLFAIATEGTQHYIQDRGADVADLVANFSGIGLGIICLRWHNRSKRGST